MQSTLKALCLHFLSFLRKSGRACGYAHTTVVDACLWHSRVLRHWKFSMFCFYFDVFLHFSSIETMRSALSQQLIWKRDSDSQLLMRLSCVIITCVWVRIKAIKFNSLHDNWVFVDINYNSSDFILWTLPLVTLSNALGMLTLPVLMPLFSDFYVSGTDFEMRQLAETKDLIVLARSRGIYESYITSLKWKCTFCLCESTLTLTRTDVSISCLWQVQKKINCDLNCKNAQNPTIKCSFSRSISIGKKMKM